MLIDGGSWGRWHEADLRHFLLGLADVRPEVGADREPQGWAQPRGGAGGVKEGEGRGRIWRRGEAGSSVGALLHGHSA